MKLLILPGHCLITSILILSYSISFAGEIKGFIYDKNTGEQLIGASISITPGSKKAVTSLDGSFSFKNISDGVYQLKISFVDYKTLDTSISVSGDGKFAFAFYLSSKSTSLSNITISKSVDAASDEFASKKEQYANSIVNIISAHAIGISPDINLPAFVIRMEIFGLLVTAGIQMLSLKSIPLQESFCKQ